MTNEEAIKELRDMLKRDIAEYGSEGSEYICEAVARAIGALDAAEKQEKNDEALMRIAAIMENIAPMIHRALAAIIDFYGEDDEEEIEEQRESKDDREMIVNQMFNEFMAAYNGWLALCRYYHPNDDPKEMPLSEVLDAIKYAKERTLNKNVTKAAANPCNNDCEHCFSVTCPKEDDDL